MCAENSCLELSYDPKKLKSDRTWKYSSLYYSRAVNVQYVVDIQHFVTEIYIELYDKNPQEHFPTIYSYGNETVHRRYH
jgi:hypothetical protein